MIEFFRRFPKRYIVSASSLAMALSLAIHDYTTYVPSSDDEDVVVDAHLEEPNDLDGETSETAEESKQKNTSLPSSSDHSIPQKPKDIIQKASDDDDSPREKLLVVGKGDTLNSLLIAAGVNKSHAQLAMDAVKKVYNVKQLKIGQGIKISLSKDPLSKEIILNGMEWRSTPEQEITIQQTGGAFVAKKNTIELKRCIEGVAGKIKSSFYNAAIKQGAPSNLAKAAVQALSFEVNFQHDPKPGNAFAILYEVYKDKTGKIVKYGNLVYAAFAPGGQLKQVYRYEGPNGATFYNHQGECAVRGFMRSPLDVTRLRVNSGYGMRMHPLKNYTAFHAGIDYGAPHGTKVVAAAAGVVTKAQYWGDFGLYVSIKHGDYTTEYAHLRKIASGIKVGTKVSQGQFIGEVGSTGSATGPHLHYGLLLKGKHVNPNSIKTMPSHKLAKQDFVKFVSFKKTIESKISSRPEKGEYVLAVTDKIIH
ncbi:MAG: peptidoglycan DD-metalloendopeptidase family protein [Alphaproteobacteria bacterium]|nr:peptidoglycan DD-metalloendopeptidase family protein [Alphaproteobacteria bacterium]